jgi:hypothetical protein
MAGETSSNDLLRISVIEGADLMPKNMNGTSNPFCIVELGRRRFTTKVIEHTSHPYWQDTFFFPVHHRGLEVKLSVWHQQRWRPNTLLGQTSVNVRELSERTLDSWFELSGRESTASYGALHLRINLLSENETVFLRQWKQKTAESLLEKSVRWTEDNPLMEDANQTLDLQHSSTTHFQGKVTSTLLCVALSHLVMWWSLLVGFTFKRVIGTFTLNCALLGYLCVLMMDPSNYSPEIGALSLISFLTVYFWVQFGFRVILHYAVSAVVALAVALIGQRKTTKKKQPLRIEDVGEYRRIAGEYIIMLMICRLLDIIDFTAQFLMIFLPMACGVQLILDSFDNDLSFAFMNCGHFLVVSVLSVVSCLVGSVFGEILLRRSNH